jgi:stage II sporulation protein R
MRQKTVTVLALIAATCVSLASLYLGRQNRAQEAYTPENLVRLHVIANSDDPLDQELKTKVRDAILRRLEPEMKTMRTSDEAYRFLGENQHLIRNACEEEISRHTSQQRLTIELGTSAFPDRTYGQVFVPEGKYRALRVVLGDGRGANWWCVLFPPLCFKDLTTRQDVTPKDAPAGDKAQPTAAKTSLVASGTVALVDEDLLRKVPVQYKSAILEWVKARKDQVMARLARLDAGLFRQ